MEKPVISAVEAAQKKKVSRQAVHQAAERGTLTSYYSAKIRLIVIDDKFEAWLKRRPNKPQESTDANS